MKTSLRSLLSLYNPFAQQKNLLLAHQKTCSIILFSLLFRMCDNDTDISADTFRYDEILLFNLETDKIEACDLKDIYPEIVEELMDILEVTVKGNYYGSVEGDPVAESVLAQVESYSCEYDETYIISWSDLDCCNNETFADWEYVWLQAIELKQLCLNSTI